MILLFLNLSRTQLLLDLYNVKTHKNLRVEFPVMLVLIPNIID